MKPSLSAVFGALGIASALALTGCASSGDSSKKGYASQIKEEVTASGDKIVSAPPYRVACSQGQHLVQSSFQCPMIGADWSSARSGIARLTIGVPDLAGAEVTGADFHMGASEVIRVRNKSATQPQIKEYAATSFDVPLAFVERLAYSPRSWVRVYASAQRQIDATVSSGEETAKAAEGLAYFMKSVDQVSGRMPSDAARGGGLLDRLGIGGSGGSGSDKGVEGMHPR